MTRSSSPASLDTAWTTPSGRDLNFELALGMGDIKKAHALWNQREASDEWTLVNQKQALDAAFTSGRASSIVFLMEHCGVARSVCKQSNDRRQTPLMFAVIRGELECVHALVPDSDPLQMDRQGRNAFNWAIQEEQWECADVLALWMPPRAVESGFLIAGVARMPQWAARLEREQLNKALALAPNAVLSIKPTTQKSAIPPLNPQALGHDRDESNYPPKSKGQSKRRRL